MAATEPWKVSRPVLSSIERGESLPSFEVLIALSNALHVDPKEMLERADQATVVPIDVSGLSLEAMDESAHEYFWRGNFRSALATYDAMVERLVLDPTLKAEQYPRLRAEIELRRATTLKRCGALLAARSAAERTIHLARRFPDAASQAYAVLSLLHSQMNNPALARDAAEKAVSVSRECGPKVQGRALMQLGKVLMDEGDFEIARQTLVKAHVLAEEGGDLRNVPSIQGDIGLCLWHLKKRAEAKRWVEKAVATARKMRLPEKEGFWLVELGRFALESSKWDEAERCADAAARIARPMEHGLNVFRAEWLKHEVVLARDPGALDRPRMTLLRKLYARLREYQGEREIQAYRQSLGIPASDQEVGAK